MPADREVIAVGVATADDLLGLIEAAKVAPLLRRLTVVAPESLSLALLAGLPLDRLTHWVATWADFRQLLEESATAFGGGVTRVRVKSNAKESELRIVDVSDCIDRSYPITQTFDLISVNVFLRDKAITEDEVRGFLEDPTKDWLPYAEGVPYPRHRQFRESLQKHLKRFGREGHAASFTAWLCVRGRRRGTTATTDLFRRGARGIPVLVARRDVTTFDFSQLSAFLTHASDRMAQEGISVPETPWVIAFDAEHTELHWEFIAGVCTAKNLIRSVVVVAVAQPNSWRSESRLKAQGTNRTLGGDGALLANSVTIDESVSLGGAFAEVPAGFTPLGRLDWEKYINDTGTDIVRRTDQSFLGCFEVLATTSAWGRRIDPELVSPQVYGVGGGQARGLPGVS